MNLNQLEKKVRKYYLDHDQWLNFTTLYENIGDTNEQYIYLDEIFDIYVQTFNNLEPYEYSYHPYLKFYPESIMFVVTIPKFKSLSKEDIERAVKYVIRENLWMIFNIKIDGETI
jgi:hypothetical protein